MTETRLSRLPAGVLATALTATGIAQVELIWIEQRIEYWLRFGREAGGRIIDRRRRIVQFRAGTVFAFVRWSANDYGTIFSSIDIARVVVPGEPYTTLPFVRPGAESLLRIEGWPKVAQVLGAIDAVDALDLDPGDVAPDHWCHVHNRIAAGHAPRAYTLARHRAWLQRRGLRP